MFVTPITSVPVMAHIKKFIDKHLGNPVVLNDTKSELIAIKSFLSYDMQIGLFSQEEVHRKLPNMVELNVIRKEYIGIKISRQNLIQINKYFEKLFEEALHRYVQEHSIRKSHTSGYKHEIERFCTQFGIELEVDISEDAIIKEYYRYRVSLQDKKKKNEQAA